MYTTPPITPPNILYLDTNTDVLTLAPIASPSGNKPAKCVTDKSLSHELAARKNNPSPGWKLNSVINAAACRLAVLAYRINHLTPNDHYSGRTAPLNSKRCILYIYSTNIGTEYFKHSVYSPFLSLQNAVCFIILTYFFSCFIHILYTGCAKI